MKKYIFAALSAVLVLGTSCTNDEIVVEADHKTNSVDVTVSLSNFFSSYDYYDTKHDINVQDRLRRFNSEAEGYIQARTLFYNSKGELADSIISYSTNTNAQIATVKLAEGDYTVISTLTFASETSGDDASLWTLIDKERLSTAKLYCKNRFTHWGIMSYASQVFTVKAGQKNSISMNPAPVGALGYMFCQDFQYKSESTYGTVADNKIREIALYSQNIATTYKLDPQVSDKYEYLNETTTNTWYYLSDPLVPSDFDRTWTYFQTNLYGFFYILTPNPYLTFGYELEGEDYFHSYGEQRAYVTSGKTYLAYWDYFKIGQPYFGIADNNHWNSYSAPFISNDKPNARTMKTMKIKDAVLAKTEIPYPMR